MGMRIACRQLAGQLDLCFGDRAHGHYHRSVEAAGRTAGEVRDEHRHQGASFHVSHADSCVDQGVLEGQAATEQEGDEIVAPEVADFPPLLDELTPTVNAVTRQIGAEVSAWGGTGGLRVARRRDLDERAGLGVAGAESSKLDSRLLWEDDQVCLLIRRALSSRAAVPFAAAGGGAHRGGRGYYWSVSMFPHSGLPKLVW